MFAETKACRPVEGPDRDVCFHARRGLPEQIATAMVSEAKSLSSADLQPHDGKVAAGARTLGAVTGAA
ncbi:hypothetical protein BQ8482_111240 [Mesorhizobium delmotii]|uniref:Uncharacterized protein n=1 Tax=Mesorhizobium delmotii TaxID=1631247 RepID=A0A2P9ADW8_9HYPH|nr:hypothetical protein BQ8482_111240 [Mesorhizobium delmotii]